jgi:hypothetical protein
VQRRLERAKDGGLLGRGLQPAVHCSIASIARFASLSHSVDGAGSPLIVIDDTSSKYKDLNEFACLDAATLAKLAAFSISPKCVLDAVELQAQVASRCSAAAAAGGGDCWGGEGGGAWAGVKPPRHLAHPSAAAPT